MPGVDGATPYLDAEGMVRGQGGEIIGVRVRGIDPARVGTVTDLREDLLPGSERRARATLAAPDGAGNGRPGSEPQASDAPASSSAASSRPPRASASATRWS